MNLLVDWNDKKNSELALSFTQIHPAILIRNVFVFRAMFNNAIYIGMHLL